MCVGNFDCVLPQGVVSPLPTKLDGWAGFEILKSLLSHAKNIWIISWRYIFSVHPDSLALVDIEQREVLADQVLSDPKFIFSFNLNLFPKDDWRSLFTFHDTPAQRLCLFERDPPMVSVVSRTQHDSRKKSVHQALKDAEWNLGVADKYLNWTHAHQPKPKKVPGKIAPGPKAGSVAVGERAK
jgi:hypothetical protein